MSIKYEIHSIKNSQGTGEERYFARIFEHEPMDAKHLKRHMQASNSLAEGSIEAVLTALREHMIHELSNGNRFYIPSIGYFSLSVDLDMPEEKSIDKVRGDYISVRNIKFRPDAAMLKEVRSNARFERAGFSSKSSEYTEQEMLDRIREFFAVNHCITRRDLETEFGLRQSAALKWLRHFVETGVLKKEGARNSPVYFLK